MLSVFSENKDLFLGLFTRSRFNLAIFIADDDLFDRVLMTLSQYVSEGSCKLVFEFGRRYRRMQNDR